MSNKQIAWEKFDGIVSAAAPDGVYTQPWESRAGRLHFVPDTVTLEKLLVVPLMMDTTSQTAVRALALDVWLSYELRRAGFHPDMTWPRAEPPRVLPMAVSSLLNAKGLSSEARRELAELIRKTPGASYSEARVLGKNYAKQVDVVMSDWSSGPELLISTKRMDSSFGKNAAHRIEEAYGDARNLRARHPMAALGFLFGLRSSVLDEAPDTAELLIDLIGKLGREDDAYHATCLVMMDYEDGGEVVKVRDDLIPFELSMSRFLGYMVNRVLDGSPVTRHREARERRAAAMKEQGPGGLGSVRADA
ncbi:hypothetical protein [uncultured Corynebacterium sp.]|uniref:hypothetical protein n=1 Tax=uncultured Corynebacterium sp. TaxID=159447 RepID=UPI0025D03501|nr:hypothetical protein [uncultured Corynebacterium sp.]